MSQSLCGSTRNYDCYFKDTCPILNYKSNRLTDKWTGSHVPFGSLPSAFKTIPVPGFSIQSPHKTIRKETLLLFYLTFRATWKALFPRSAIPTENHIVPASINRNQDEVSWRHQLFFFSLKRIHFLKPSSSVESKTISRGIN